jgi:hypothetical protein
MADGVYRLLGKHKDILARYSEAQREVSQGYSNCAPEAVSLRETGAAFS